jgi:hypothetical protein
MVRIECGADLRHAGAQRSIGHPLAPSIELQVGDSRTNVLMLMGSLGRGGQHTREAEQAGAEQASQANGTIRSDHYGDLPGRKTNKRGYSAARNTHP